MAPKSEKFCFYGVFLIALFADRPKDSELEKKIRFEHNNCPVRPFLVRNQETEFFVEKLTEEHPHVNICQL